jgi:WD40 repeat protein
LDAESGELLRELSFPRPVSTIAASRDGQTLAVALWDYGGEAGDPEENTIQLIARSSGKVIRQLAGHIGQIMTLAFSADDKTLVSGSADGTFRQWQVKTGKEERKIDMSRGSYSASIAIDTSRRMAVVSWPFDDSFLKWDLVTGKQLASLRLPNTSGSRVALSPDGRILARGPRSFIGLPGSADRAIVLFDLRSGVELQRFELPDNGIASLVFSPDGQKLVTGNCRGTALVWDVSRAYGKLK